MRAKSQEDGFALIEALVALAIFALSLTMLFGTITDCARRLRLAETHRAAELVAQSALAAAGTAYPVDNGSASGVQGPFYWWMQAAPYDRAPSDGVCVAAAQPSSS
jgi:general secretion pathway protein I